MGTMLGVAPRSLPKTAATAGLTAGAAAAAAGAEAADWFAVTEGVGPWAHAESSSARDAEVIAASDGVLIMVMRFNV